jgi:hypothetical protein
MSLGGAQLLLTLEICTLRIRLKFQSVLISWRMSSLGGAQLLLTPEIEP